MVEDGEDEILIFKVACKRAAATFALQFARDGREAIEYFSGTGPYADRQQHPIPALVILDINMPSVSGFEVLEWIRKHPQFKNVPVVMLTTSMFDTDVSRAYALGANSYLVKPVDTKVLVEMIPMLERYWIGMNRVPGNVLDQRS
ncbi:response regulator [Rariglobus hedericola]|uniref:response regulator n=1 Tax=Rariglobus hedericola TaxID=2597822 RepID=UPI001939E146|nr:response regulator [Rariglobus hedericola]